MKHKLSDGSTGFINERNEWQSTGARRGRANNIPDNPERLIRLSLEKVTMSRDGCYDQGGAYWGIGTPLYVAFGEDDERNIEIFERGKTRDEAKTTILRMVPGARFYR